MPRSTPFYLTQECPQTSRWCSLHGYQHLIVCKVCGRKFHSRSIDAETCSDKCRKDRQRQHEQRHT